MSSPFELISLNKATVASFFASTFGGGGGTGPLPTGGGGGGGGAAPDGGGGRGGGVCPGRGGTGGFMKQTESSGVFYVIGCVVGVVMFYFN